jgi:hypothetical protein
VANPDGWPTWTFPMRAGRERAGHRSAARHIEDAIALANAVGDLRLDDLGYEGEDAPSRWRSRNPSTAGRTGMQQLNKAQQHPHLSARAATLC